MDKDLEKNSSNVIICPSCGTLNSMGNNQCTKCKYLLKTWTTYEDEANIKNDSNIKEKPIIKLEDKPEEKEEPKEVENPIINEEPKEEIKPNITQENADNTNINSKPDILIGILLIFPIYIVIFFIIISVLRLRLDINPYILLPILMYVPVIIGILLSYKYYSAKASKVFSFVIIIFLCLALYNFYNTYFVEHEGWDGLTPFFVWAACSIITKILACIYYGKLVGWKKGLLFFIIYVVTVVLSAVLGFWA